MGCNNVIKSVFSGSMQTGFVAVLWPVDGRAATADTLAATQGKAFE
jgi:hypothetical protein